MTRHSSTKNFAAEKNSGLGGELPVLVALAREVGFRLGGDGRDALLRAREQHEPRSHRRELLLGPPKFVLTQSI